jgi:flagellar motor switch protein FliM
MTAMSDPAAAPPGPPRPASAANRTGLAVLATGGLPGLDRLPLLHTVLDRLAAALTGGFRTMLGPDAEVRVGPPRSLRLQEFRDRIVPGVPIAVLRFEPWGGTCLAVLDPGVAATAVEAMLGGGRRVTSDAVRRAYTAIEQAVIARMARDTIGRALATAFSIAGAAGIAMERLETDASRVTVGKPAAPGIALRADVRLGDSIGGIELLFPYASIEPMRDRLSQGTGDGQRDSDAAWRAHLTAELPLTHVRLRAVIAQRRVQAAEIMQWQVGSKLALRRRHDESIDVFCHNLLVLRGRIAEQDGHIALHIEERRTAEDWLTPDAQLADPPADASAPAAPLVA